MNKAELIDAVTARLGVDKRTANNAVEAILDTVQRAVAKGEKVAITGFGVFERIERPARMGRNPATGEQVRLKKTAVPKFRAGTEFKGVVSGARKLAKVADAATKAAARSVSDSAARTARTAAAAPGKAASAAGKAANRAGGTGRKTATSRSAARPAKAASKTTTKKTTARKTATKRAG